MTCTLQIIPRQRHCPESLAALIFSFCSSVHFHISCAVLLTHFCSSLSLLFIYYPPSLSSSHPSLPSLFIFSSVFPLLRSFLVLLLSSPSLIRSLFPISLLVTLLFLHPIPSYAFRFSAFSMLPHVPFQSFLPFSAPLPSPLGSNTS